MGRVESKREREVVIVLFVDDDVKTPRARNKETETPDRPERTKPWKVVERRGGTGKGEEWGLV